MKALKLSKIEIDGEMVDLGEDPTGFMTRKGDVYTYDNIYVMVRDEDKIKAFDEEGIPFEATSIRELIREANLLDAWGEM